MDPFTMSVAPGPKASSSATNRRNTTGSSQRPSSRINNELNTPGRITLPPSSISIPKPEIPAVLLESLNSPCTGYTCSYKRMAKILTANNASSVLAAFNDHQVSHILKHLQGIECMAGVDTPIEEIDLETAMGKFGTQAHESPVEDGMGSMKTLAISRPAEAAVFVTPKLGRKRSRSHNDTIADFLRAKSSSANPTTPSNQYGDTLQLRTPPHNSPYIYSQQPTFPPIHDPRYLQVGGFAGTPPTYPIALHPQHSWRLPSDLASTMHPRTPTDYPAMFREDGAPAENYKEDRFGFTILPNSRGAFINPIPAYSTLEQVCENIRGGALERVDFHDYQGRTCVGFFFISAEEAMRYIKFCNQQGGVYWAGTGLVSKVEAIPTGKGGHEPIKANVSKGIREGATRCLKICHLPNNIDVELLKAQIKNQSRNVVAEIETIHMVPENPGSHPTFTGFIRMATIGTALGARLRLANLAYYKNCTFEFLPDPCAGTLEELTHKWNTEKYWDGCIARSKQLDTPSVPAPMEMQTMQGGLHPPSFLDLQRGVRTPPF